MGRVERDFDELCILRVRLGWGGWTRTNTVLINSEVSYQLDHAPAAIQIVSVTPTN